MAGLQQLQNTEEITDIQYHMGLYEELIENLDNAVEAGVMDEATAKAHKAQAIIDLNNRLLESENIDEEELQAIYGDSEYSQGDEGVANFSIGNRFGAALIELGEQAGYDDIKSLVYDIAELTENDPEDIAGLITGDSEPDDNLAIYLARCFELDEEYTTDLRLAAMEARGETLEDYEDSDEDEDEEDAEYSQVTELNNRIAEFEQNQQIRDALNELELKAKQVMPPSAVKVLFGDFQLESDRVAAFSRTADLNGVGVAEELYAMQKTIELFEKSGLNKLAMFQSYSTGTATEVTDEDAEIEAQAKRNFELRKARSHNLI